VTSPLAVERLIQFLDEKEEEIMAAWIKKMGEHGSDDATLKPIGKCLYQLLKSSIITPLPDESLQTFAEQLAEERAKGKGNIGDFVYQIICGRRVLFHYILQFGFSLDEIGEALDHLITTFDRFCYFSVAKYSEIKDKELAEKVFLINQTHKDRLTLLGQLSSSFVHEFRNPLTSVMGFVKLLKSDPHHTEYLEIIEYELQQLNYRITQFLHTSKKDIADKDKEMVSLAAIMTEILDFIYPLMVDLDCEWTTNIESDCHFFAYRSELKQVLQNILLNSLDALKERPKPRRVSVISRKEERYVMIRVSNNGPKIPEDKIETIFEPFFTTKELGTGIGLYVCKKIIEKHKGKIVCESDEAWTRFTIYLPLEIYYIKRVHLNGEVDLVWP
jgi:signal transduction histidine kinase